MGEIFTKFKKCKFLNACCSMKESANGKNYGSIVIPKVWGVCFVSIFPRRPKIQAFVCLMLDKWFCRNFFLSALVIRITWKKLPVYGKSDDPNFILVHTYIWSYRKQAKIFKLSMSSRIRWYIVLSLVSLNTNSTKAFYGTMCNFTSVVSICKLVQTSCGFLLSYMVAFITYSTVKFWFCWYIHSHPSALRSSNQRWI